jgi:hypothetical protein
MSANSSSGSTLPAEIRAIIEERLAFGHFFVQPPASISLERVSSEALTWEIYHGRLLDAAQTRRRQTFESWNLYWTESDNRSAEPLLSVKFDADQNCLHVTRGIECYAWEAYDDGNNVILTREVRKWTRELVATLDLGAYSNLDHLRDDLGFRLFQAVIGTSRLPLTSLESPLPGFTLGKFAYFASWMEDPTFAPRETPFEILYERSSKREEAKAVEFLLRTQNAMPMKELARRFVEWWEFGNPFGEIPALVVRLLDEVSLSPYTDFVENVLGFLRALQEQGTLSIAAHADVLCTILRRLGRHLTAFDLVKFHHRGANYPDLLMLDAVLKELLALAGRQWKLFPASDWDHRREGRLAELWMRGLRQAYFFRRRYEGHPVPEVPTSMGENTRVLPSSIPHLTEEAILDPTCRVRRLFADDLIAPQLTPHQRGLIRVSFDYLDDSRDVQELGTALFLDRPLGIFKHPTQPDQTLLLSYVAYSRTIAERRLCEMSELGLLNDEQFAKAKERLAALQVDGMPIPMRGIPSRPGVPSLADAFKVAPDFVLLHTTRRTVNDFLTQYDVNAVRHRFPLELLPDDNRVVILGGGEGVNPASLMIYTPALRLEFTFDSKAGYRVHRCHEYPASGLQLVRVWQPDKTPSAMIERDVRGENIRIGPRS